MTAIALLRASLPRPEPAGPYQPGAAVVRHDRATLLVAILVLATALLLGGGGKRFPWAEIVVELVAAAGLTVALWRQAGRPLPAGSGLALAIIGLILALIAAQLVPLPESVWSGLPGRSFEAQVIAANGGAGASMPISLDPEATIRSALTLLPALAMFFLVLALPNRDRILLAQLVVALAIASLILGTLQASTRSPSLYLFSTAHLGNPVGFFSNRNHQASFLLVAIVLTGLIVARGPFPASPGIRRAVGLALLLTFTLGTIATPSRMGTLLLPVAWIGYAIPNVRLQKQRLRWTLIPVLVLLAGAVLLVTENRVVRYTFARFDNLEDARFAIWRDTRWSIDQFTPFGSGLGTFERVFAAGEPLSTVMRLSVNHAHNEYLELLLELGPGMLAPLLLFLILLLRAGLSLRSPARNEDRPFVIAGLVIVGLLMLHSLVDYPLRMLAMLALFGTACAMLLPSPGQRQRDGQPVG